jgi:hypothetical protein
MLSVVTLSVVILSVIILSVVILSVVMLSVVILYVVAPSEEEWNWTVRSMFDEIERSSSPVGGLSFKTFYSCNSFRYKIIVTVQI